MNKTKNNIQKSLALFLPGIFLLGFNIGTGSVTSMAKAGATYGMSLLWTIVASCLATYFMINLYSRYTMVTDETALQAFRKHIHPAVGIFFIVALTTGVMGSVMGVMGIVADISEVWSESFIEGGIPAVWFAAFYIALVYFIFWNGETQFFERALAVVVAIMAVCFLVNFLILMPPPAEILSGLIPNIPTVELDKSPYLVIASLVGTTVFSGLFISQAFNSVILPVTVACILYLGNRKDLMQQYRFTWITNSILFLILAFSIFTSVIGIRGVLQLLQT